MLFTWMSQLPLVMLLKNADLAVATVSLKMKDGEANAVALRKNSADLKEVVDKVIQKTQG